MNPDESDSPDLLEAIQAVVDDALEQVYTCLPARVVRYDEGRQAVDAQPYLKVPVRRGDGTVLHERLPVVLNAPVLYPTFSYGCRVTGPIRPGLTVILFFPSAAIDRWLLTGVEIDTAGDASRHRPTAAFAMPAGHSFGGPAKPLAAAGAPPQDAMVIHATG